ncbi:tRNA (cytosine(38)-C(5))-methyltransferase [Augochlora pura]
MRVLELYSGIGGMHYAFQESGVNGDCVAAIDINTVANDVYKHNFPHVCLMNRNIQSITAEEVNDLHIDTILMSPPCQPYTRVGLQKDVSDNRSSSLFYVLELIPRIKTLKYILLENVKGFEKSEMRDAVLKCLNNFEFHYRELILSPCRLGIPNSRHRYYLLAKKKNLKFCFDNTTLNFKLPQDVLRALPRGKHKFLGERCTREAEDNKNCYVLHNILENVEDVQYLVPSKLLQKRAWVLDLRTSESNGSCCFTKAYGHYAEGTGSVYCPYSEEVIKEAYLAADKCGRESLEAVEILEKLKLRYFTPREICRLMCFPEDFTFPGHITRKQKYRLLGNSINVYVVSRLIFLLHSEKQFV